MAYYWTCPECGSNLDPGEKCSDCNNKYKEELKHENDSEKVTHPELQRV